MSKTLRYDARTALRQIARANDCRADVKAGCIVDRYGRSSYPTKAFLKSAWEAYLASRD